MIPFLRERCSEVVACDLSLKMLQAARDALGGERVCLAQVDAETLPFGNHEFDVVVALGVAEYILPPEAWLAEIARVLRLGGTATLTFPHGQCVARRIGQFLRWVSRLSRPLRERSRTGSGAELKQPLRSPRTFDSLLKGSDFRKMGSVFCGVRVIPRPLNRYRRLNELADRLESVQWFSGLRMFGCVYVVTARVALCVRGGRNEAAASRNSRSSDASRQACDDRWACTTSCNEVPIQLWHT